MIVNDSTPKGGDNMGTREITAGTDRQGKPALLSTKESIAQQIINAIFLVPGNIPNLPIGLNIEDYLYKSSSNIQPNEIMTKLKTACGEEFINSNVGSLECGVVNINNIPMFWLSAHLLVDDDENDTMALVLTKQNDTVKFNYEFLSESVKKAYGV